MSYITIRIRESILIISLIGTLLICVLTTVHYSVILKERENEIDTLRDRVRELEIARSNLASKLKEMLDSINELNNTIDELRKLKTELEKDNARLFYRISQLELENKALSREIDVLKNIIELRLNKSLLKIHTPFKIEPRENTTFTYVLNYPGYFIITLDTQEPNVFLKIQIRGNYSSEIYSYEHSLNIGVTEVTTILPVLPGYVELVIINTSTRSITVEVIEIVYVY